jgi:peptide/nickel transport system substrate-binding protein
MTHGNHSKRSRRQVIGTGIAGGSALALAGLLGPNASAQDATPAATPATPATTPIAPVATPTGSFAPQTGIEREELIIGVQGLPATLDPAQELSNVGSRVNWTPYDTLIRRDFLNGNVNVPHLATGWTQVSETVLDLTLREGVTFHNGDPFTADDVVFTFQRLFDAAEDSNLVEAGTYFSSFASVEKTGDYAVRITTTQPDPLILNRLASWGGWIVPQGHITTVGQDEFQRTGMGTGPFRFVSFTPDDEIVLERYDGFWGDLPPVKRVVFRVIPEVAARVTALANGEVQLITNVPPDQVETLSASENVDVREIVLSNTHVLVYNTNQPGLQDKRLRQALNLGIDRQLLIDAIWAGTARAKRSHQFEEYGYLFNPERPFTPYDPERARQLVEESDYNGELIPYQTVAGYYTNAEQSAQAIVQMWQDIGINTEVQILEASANGAERFVHTWSNSSLLADPDGSLNRSWGPESNTQAQYWAAPEEFNQLAIAARSTLDQQTRYDAYQRMLDLWEDDAPGTVLYDPAEFYGVSKSVNWSPYPLYNMDLRAWNLSFNDAG